MRGREKRGKVGKGREYSTEQNCFWSIPYNMPSTIKYIVDGKVNGSFIRRDMNDNGMIYKIRKRLDNDGLNNQPNQDLIKIKKVLKLKNVKELSINFF